MAVTVQELVDELTLAVPASDGVPSDAQYEKAVKDAVRAFGERCGLEQIWTLTIVAGTATYDLPEDFLALIEMVALATQDGVIVSSAGIIPVGASWKERYTIRNGQITFTPTPTYSMERLVRYKAGWVLDTGDEDYGVDDAYPEMTEREARIVLLKAQALALGKQANASSGSGMKYSLGAVSFDGTGEAAGLLTTRDTRESEFEDECRKYNGHVLRM